MKKYLTVSELRELDSKAIEVLQMSETLLIENAARGAAGIILKEFSCGSVYIFAGCGNNGADGLALARHLLNKDIEVKIVVVSIGKEYNKEVKYQLDILNGLGASPEGRGLDIAMLTSEEDIDSFITENDFAKDMVIDAVFGIGFSGKLKEAHLKLFSFINNSAESVVSLDIPSGLESDSESVEEAEAIEADVTVSFIAEKKVFQAEGTERFCGKIFVSDIGVSRKLLEAL